MRSLRVTVFDNDRLPDGEHPAITGARVTLYGRDDAVLAESLDPGKRPSSIRNARRHNRRGTNAPNRASRLSTIAHFAADGSSIGIDLRKILLRAISRRVTQSCRMHDLKNKSALVTGGTRGLGRAISLGLARLGATVAMNYRRDDASAERTLAEVRAIAPRSILVKADLEDDAQVRAMVSDTAAKFGRLDILIANAAATAFKPLLETKPHNLARTFALSVNGFVAAVQEASKTMARRRPHPDDFRHRLDS